MYVYFVYVNMLKHIHMRMCMCISTYACIYIYTYIYIPQSVYHISSLPSHLEPIYVCINYEYICIWDPGMSVYVTCIYTSGTHACTYILYLLQISIDT